MTTPIQVDCGGYTATVSIDRDTGDDVPALRIAQDDTYVLFDATEVEPLMAAIRQAVEGINDDSFPKAA